MKYLPSPAACSEYFDHGEKWWTLSLLGVKGLKLLLCRLSSQITAVNSPYIGTFISFE